MTKATANLKIYRGDDFDAVWGFWARGGALIYPSEATDNVGGFLVDGVPVIGLPDGVFLHDPRYGPRNFDAADIGTVVSILTGSGIVDGTTILDVASDGRSCTLDTDADASRADAAIVVRAADLSDFASISAHCRATADGSKLFDLPIDRTRDQYGVLTCSIPSLERATEIGMSSPSSPAGKITNTITTGGTYDLQFVASDKRVSTPVGGKISVEKDWTHA